MLSMSNAPPAWDETLLDDPHTVADKQRRVRDMFAAIARSYDLNNRVHSFGRDQAWRREAVRLSSLRPSDCIVDVACGTGDLAFLFHNALSNARPTADSAGQHRDAGSVIGIDYTFPMLERASLKSPGSSAKLGRNPIAWINGDAQHLPLADESADVVSIAFGIRNVQEPKRAIAEFFRVLRPGGRVIILEFSHPTNRLIRWANDLYCTKIMPRTATWISGDKSGAYRYLPTSVRTFIDREGMKQMLRDAGFVDVSEHPMTFGVAVVYRGYKR